MRCPECDSDRHRVTNTRHYVGEDGDSLTRRRRECLNKGCRHRWTTHEVYDVPDLTAERALAEAREKASAATEILGFIVR